MGKKRLEDAIGNLEHPVKVVYRSFELDPTVERDVPYNIYEKLASKYGMSLDQAKANCHNMVQMAQDAGLDFHLDTLVLTNTFDAHRLAKFAGDQGLMHEMTDRLLRAYYTESKHIGDHSTLIDLAEEIGLIRETVASMLASNKMSNEVRADEQEAQELAIRSVPFFLVNRKYSISGAQPTETFISALNQIIEQDGPYIEPTGLACDDDGCEIPKK